MNIEELEKELSKKIASINPETELKVKALDFALHTCTIDSDRAMSHSLDGADEVLKAAQKYYDFMKGNENG